MRSLHTRRSAGPHSRGDLRSLLRSVEGWLTVGEAELLYFLAKACPQGTAIVEVGSFKGRSTICLAKGAEAGSQAHVYAVDPHLEGTYGDFLRNLQEARVVSRVTPVCKPSREANRGWSQPIGLLFIDGNHEYASVEEDFLLWAPHVVEGSVIALHDTTSSIRNQLMGYSGPRKVARKYLFAPAMNSVGFVDTITFSTKGKIPGWRGNLASNSVWFQKLFPDTLLYLHHHVISRLPPRMLDAIRNGLYGKRLNASSRPRKTMGRAARSGAHESPADVGSTDAGSGGRRSPSVVIYLAEALETLNHFL